MKNNPVKLNFLILHGEVLEDQKLTLPEKCILSLIISFAVIDKECFVSNEFIMKLFNLERSQVILAIQNLLQLNYIETSMYKEKNLRQLKLSPDHKFSSIKHFLFL